MARTKISEFSATPANNTDIDSINISEGCAPSGINDAIRELMAQLKDFQTGAVGDSFNGPVGTTTAAAGAFTTLSASSTVSGTGFSTYLASPPAIGGTAAAAGSFTTLSASGAVTLSGGTANGVAYLNGSKVLTSGSAITFSGQQFAISSLGDQIKISNSVGNQLLTLSSNSAGSVFTSHDGTNFVPILWQSNTAEQMRLTSTGLGIGTSSPASKLAVVGEARVYTGSNLGYWGVDGGNSYVYFGTNSSGYSLSFQTGGSDRMRLDSSGNLGLGVTPSVAGAGKTFEIGTSVGNLIRAAGQNDMNVESNTIYNSGFKYANNGYANRFGVGAATGQFQWFTAPSGTAGNAITFTQAMTLDSSGNLLVGTTSASGILTVVQGGSNANGAFITNQTYNYQTLGLHNTATANDNLWVVFGTEASFTGRGSISYNRAGGLTMYNTTSDYRAKDISGSVTDSGALIDSVPVYMGKMKGATQERPMFIAHETPAYAHTGEKDAVDADGNPVYQQMDASALIPVMWAEIQSLRKRLADAGIA